VIVGPGNLYVQEAKRQVSGVVGIDGFAGPSDLVVLFTAAPDLAAADLAAQAEHGEGSVVIAVSPDAALLARVEERLHDVDADAQAFLVEVSSVEEGLAFAEDFAPEHLELIGPEAEALAPRVRRAGCLFVGAASATAFGDYVAGSNHVLPTGGAARFASALGPSHFRRRLSEVRIGPAAGALAAAAVPIARAEGFELHARSMEVRENGAG
jgi:histidinol dehydrogenase